MRTARRVSVVGRLLPSNCMGTAREVAVPIAERGAASKIEEIGPVAVVVATENNCAAEVVDEAIVRTEIIIMNKRVGTISNKITIVDSRRKKLT